MGGDAREEVTESLPERISELKAMGKR